jgi:hypothetical protein
VIFTSPFDKRGTEGDLYLVLAVNLQVTLNKKISPNPSLSKRGFCNTLADREEI